MSVRSWSISGRNGAAEAETEGPRSLIRLRPRRTHTEPVARLRHANGHAHGHVAELGQEPSCSGPRHRFFTAAQVADTVLPHPLSCPQSSHEPPRSGANPHESNQAWRSAALVSVAGDVVGCVAEEITYVIGDATGPTGPFCSRVIAHVRNDAGGWGTGFVPTGRGTKTDGRTASRSVLYSSCRSPARYSLRT